MAYLILKRDWLVLRIGINTFNYQITLQQLFCQLKCEQTPGLTENSEDTRWPHSGKDLKQKDILWQVPRCMAVREDSQCQVGQPLHEYIAHLYQENE